MVPFLMIGFYHDPIEHMVTVAVLMGFPLGVFLVKVHAGKTNVHDYSKDFLVSDRWIYLLFLVYTIANIENIQSITSALMRGELLGYSYARVVERYEGSGFSKAGLITRLGTLSFLILGSLLPYTKPNNKYILLTCVFIMIAIESAGLARLGVLFLFTSFAIGFVIKNNKKISSYSIFKMTKIGIYMFVVLSVIFLFSAYFRVSHKDNVIDILLVKLLVYTVAMYDAYYVWLDSQQLVGNGYGFNTLAGVYKIFGHEVAQGFYTPSDTYFGPTNIYTNLRGLLSDFGVVFSFLYFLICGVLITTFSSKPAKSWYFIFLHFTMFQFIFVLISPYNYFNLFAAITLSAFIITGLRISRLKLL